MENHSFRHVMPAQIRFSDVDKYGHVNNSVYFSLFDMSKTQYLIDVIGVEKYEHMAMVVAHVEADFINPIFYPDEIVIQTSVVKLGRKSFTLVQQALNKRTKEIKCSCQTIMVFYDVESQQSSEIPEEVRKLIEEFEHNG